LKFDNKFSALLFNMADKTKPEVWLRGPLDGISTLLQPVAHALLQAREEINELMTDLPEELLWERPAGVASPGFHLQHLTGVLDRLFTYASGELLTQQQLNYLAGEGKPADDLNTLLTAFNNQVDIAIKQLSETNEVTLTETRGVGRAQIPSTVISLLIHAAEHTMRHTGQLLITIKVLLSGN
jgi:uncharacterized damage-inducible protein DinB